MLYNSIEFAIFLPIVFVLYWFVFGRSYRAQNLFIVLASYFFYGWWDWKFLFLITFTSLSTWGGGMLTLNCKGDGLSRKRKIIASVVALINLLVLGVFKYYDFFAQSFADLFLDGKSDGVLLNLVLPIGISFYTFKALSYTIDVYHGKIEPIRDVVQFFAFLSYFPQLVAGPIERATNLLPQFGRQRNFEYDEAVDGMRQMLWGLFKKVVVADNCAVYVDEIFGTYQMQSGSTLLLAAVLFTFQIYGDFSGYSDMAIGCSKLFGIRLMKNFNFPYFSRDIAEFWRRWHISLTTWFRDYVYIPLGGSRCSKWKVIRNTFVIFLLSGLWHGANWTFVAWGAYNALLFLPLILLGKNRKHKDVVASDRMLPSIREIVQMFLTFVLVVFGWVLFRSNTIGDAWQYVSLLPTRSLFSIPYLLNRQYYIPVSISIVLMLVYEWINRRKEHAASISGAGIFSRYFFDILIVLMICICGGQAEGFIYLQF